MTDKEFLLWIFLPVWSLGIILNYALVFVELRRRKKINPKEKFTVRDLLDIQYDIGGPLILIPLLGLLLDIILFLIIYTSIVEKIKKFLDKEI